MKHLPHSLVVFTLGEEFYASPIEPVREILRIPEIIPVPQASPYVEGVMSYRGHVLTVINMRRFFDLKPSKPSPAQRLMIVRLPSSLVGLLVDSVEEVVPVTEGALEPIPETAGNSLTRRGLAGVTRWKSRLVMLLDLFNLLSPEQVHAVTQLRPEVVA